MCTLIALHRCAPGADLWIAANRDEYLGRPAEGPALRWFAPAPGTPSDEPTLAVAPLDLDAGGTWWGVNARGVFAAVTNRPVSDPDRRRRSRGRLVTDALAASSAREVAARLAALPERAYNPFNFFAADARDAFAATCSGVAGDAPEVWRLDPGVHVIGNADPREAAAGKARRTRDAAVEAVARARGGRDADLLGALAEICRSHGPGDDPLASICVHTGAGYGTRSSTLLKLGEEPALHHAEGPPCENGYRSFTALLEALGPAPARREERTAARKAS